MKNVKRLFVFSIVFIFILYLNSCITCWVGNKFAYRFDGKITGIDSLISVDGYYQILHSENNSDAYFMFYRDGTFASFFWFEKNKTNSEKPDTMSHIGGWGVYKIIGDTIKTQSVWNQGEWNEFTLAPFEVLERWFKIISRDTLLDIYYQYIESSNNRNWEYLNKKIYFTPLANRPDSSCWLKRKSWAWENGEIKE